MAAIDPLSLVQLLSDLKGEAQGESTVVQGQLKLTNKCRETQFQFPFFLRPIQLGFAGGLQMWSYCCSRLSCPHPTNSTQWPQTTGLRVDLPITFPSSHGLVM